MDRSTANIVLPVLTELVSLAALPLFVLLSLFAPRLRRTLKERFLGGEWKNLAPREARLWFHAASVGEVQGIAPLVKLFEGRYPLVVTTTSDTGFTLAREMFPTVAILILPFDERLLMRAACSRIRPALLVINETELWPNMLFELRAKNIPSVLVNARISHKTIGRYNLLKPLVREMLVCLSVVAAQSRVDERRFLSLDCQTEKLRVMGNSKYDSKITSHDREQIERLRAELATQQGQPTLIAGSLRPGEEAPLLEMYQLLLSELTELRLIVAPRHPEQFERMSEFFAGAGLRTARKSVGPILPDLQVLVLDTIGELRFAYGLGTIAFIGGSFVPIGGHNPIEAAAHGVPVCFGPYTENLPGIIDSLAEHGALLQVKTGAGLAQLLLPLFKDRTSLEKLRTQTLKAVAEHSGSTEKYCELIASLLETDMRANCKHVG